MFGAPQNFLSTLAPHLQAFPVAGSRGFNSSPVSFNQSQEWGGLAGRQKAAAPQGAASITFVLFCLPQPFSI